MGEKKLGLSLLTSNSNKLTTSNLDLTYEQVIQVVLYSTPLLNIWVISY